MAPVGIQEINAIPSAAAEPAVADGVRLSLDPALAQRRGINGAWWPHSRDAGAELPAMLHELSTRARRVSRVALQVDAFSNIPHRLTAGGHTTHVAWFRSMNTHTINLTMAGRDNLTLLVVPPQASPAEAAEALRMASASHPGQPQDILAAAGITSGEPGKLPQP
jgi:Family of unknown function (DUF5994)